MCAAHDVPHRHANIARRAPATVSSTSAFDSGATTTAEVEQWDFDVLVQLYNLEENMLRVVRACGRSCARERARSGCAVLCCAVLVLCCDVLCCAVHAFVRAVRWLPCGKCANNDEQRQPRGRLGGVRHVL